jgi:hypothetical protein
MIAPSAQMISSYSIPPYRQMLRKLRFPMTDDTYRRVLFRIGSFPQYGKPKVRLIANLEREMTKRAAKTAAIQGFSN